MAVWRMLYATLGRLFHDEVTVHNRETVLQCGKDTKLCSISLNKASAKFTSWHDETGTQIVYEGEEEFHNNEWHVRIEKSSSAHGNDNVLHVHCCPKRSGKARVKLDLGSWYKFPVSSDSEFSITVQSSSPTELETTSSPRFQYPAKDIPQETPLDFIPRNEKVSVGATESYMNRKSVTNDIDIKHISVNSDNNFSETHSYVELIPEFDDLVEQTKQQPLFPCDDHFKCSIHLKDGSQHTYAPKSLSSSDLTVRYYNKAIKDAKIELLHPGIYQAVVPLKGIRIGDEGKARFTFIFEKKEIPLYLNFTVYNKFNEVWCKSTRSKRGQNVRDCFQCENILATEIEGKDRCHLDNIERICFKDQDKRIVVEDIESHVCLILPPLCNREVVAKCRKVLLHPLKAIYYRKKASETDKERIMWKEKAVKEHDRGKREINEKAAAIHWHRAAYCKSIKEKYVKLMQRYNEEASKEIFTFFNEDRGLNHVDLHGLLVVDEEKLAKDKEELLKDKSEEEVTNIINERRDEGDEAIRMLKTRIDEFMENMEKARRDRKTWLEVIVGAGHHSAVTGKQKIRPKVEEYLEKKFSGKLDVVNKGSLVVTFEEYPDSKRCFGYYFCQTCKKDWRSGLSFKNKWQGCLNCHERGKGIKECLPKMQSPLITQQQGQHAGGKNQPHNKQLCQVCTENGSCINL